MVSTRPALGVLATLATFSLCACDGGGADAGPGTLSEGEARALDEAARMLDEKRLPEGALPPTNQAETDSQAPADAKASETARN